MKRNIKIFFASSDEMQNDRNAFGNFIRRLGKIYERRGITLELFLCEDCDAAYKDERKQKEYNEHVKSSDMFVAAFHKKAGPYTQEEFDVAVEELRQKSLPNVYVYCREVQEDEIETDSLKEFKRRLDKMGIYWVNYSNTDTMHLRFLLELQRVENSSKDAIKVEDGVVRFDGMPIARMDRLPFAALNEDFCRKNSRLQELPIKIAKMRSKIEKYPDEEDFRSDLQELFNEYNKLKDEFAEDQKSLLAMAIRVVQMQGCEKTDRMRRALDAFNGGDIRRANTILDEVEKDGERALERFLSCKELTERERKNVFNSIEELLLKASTVMADMSIDIEDRKTKASLLYAQAVDMAQKSEYDKEKYSNLLAEYGEFLYEYAYYDMALDICEMNLSLEKEIYGESHPTVATSYNNIGCIYSDKGNYGKALSYLEKSLAIKLQHYGESHPTVATSYNNLGSIYSDKGNNAQALLYYERSLAIIKEVYGESHPAVALSYNNFGNVYSEQGNNIQALSYYERSLAIWLQHYGESHPAVATSYNNIGSIYSDKGNNAQALSYYERSLVINKQYYGESHPAVALSYNNLGSIYSDKGNNAQALSYYERSLAIRLQHYGESHPAVAASYNGIGLSYLGKEVYGKALSYCEKSLAINKQYYGESHPDVATSYNNIGKVYSVQGNNAQALSYYEKSLAIRKEVYGESHPDVATSYDGIGLSYLGKEDYGKALSYYEKSLAIRKEVYGESHPDVATSYGGIGLSYLGKEDYGKALSYFEKSLEMNLQYIDKDNNNMISVCGIVYCLYHDILKSDNSVLSRYCEFMADKTIVVTIKEGETPAAAQGMSGWYYLLEYADWNIESPTSLYDKIKETKDSSVDIVVLQNGVVSKHHFEDAIGAKFDLRYVEAEEKQQIIDKYKEYKKDSKNGQ